MAEASSVDFRERNNWDNDENEIKDIDTDGVIFNQEKPLLSGKDIYDRR